MEADVILSIEDSRYRLKIKTVGPSVQVIQPAHIPCSSPLAKAMDSNHGVVGFEDLDDEVALEDDVECSNWRRDVIANAKQVGKEVNETSKIPINSNTTREDERQKDNPFESIHTQSRTKTACFSQNGYSEEIFKATQHLYSLEADAKHKEPEINDKQPLGFERNDNDNHVLVFSPTKEINVPLLGFESIVTPLTSKKVPRRNLQVIDRRVTRSQKKLANPHSSSSQDTSESLIKLAKESLEVGKLLGMVVIDKEEAALGRITNGFRKERKALKNKLPNDLAQASE